MAPIRGCPSAISGLCGGDINGMTQLKSMNMKKTLLCILMAGFCLTSSAQPLDLPVTYHRSHHTQRLPGINEQRLARLEKMRQANVERRNRKGPYRAETKTAQKKGLVLLLQFSDTMMRQGADTDWYDRFNKQGFALDSHVGSVRDYFLEQSYGQLSIDFDVVGPLTLSKTHDYYGTAPNDNLNDRAAEMICEALQLADSQVNYADYDWDGDGEVDQVFAIYAGGSYGTNDIWPHEWGLYSAHYYGSGSGPQYLDGVVIDTYAVSNEISDWTGLLEGIGSACHEFSHCLGFPDYYDTSYSGGSGGTAWDLLDTGSYNGPDNGSQVPSPFTAYERASAGWMDLTPLTEPTKVTGMPAVNEEGVAYIITNSGNKNEYYILENRQRVTFGTYNYGHGLMVWHIDYSKTAWTNNEVNVQTNHQRMTYVPADGRFGTLTQKDGQSQYKWTDSDLEGDPYPGSQGVTSVAQLTWFTAEKNGTKKHASLIHHIKESADGKLSFIYGDYPVLDTPEAIAPSDLFSEAFTANWLPVEDATSYSLKVTAQTGTALPVTVLVQDFSGFAKASAKTKIGSSVVSSYMGETGWTPVGCYGTGEASVCLGSASTSGSLTTPALSNREGTLQVDIEAAYYGTDGSSVVVSVLKGSETLAEKTIPLTASATPYSLSFDDVPAACSVRFATTGSGKRVCLSNVKITDMTDAGSVTTIYEGLTGTSFTIYPTEASVYFYCVKAVCADGESEWSDWVDVDLSSAQGLASPSRGACDDVNIYDLSGRRLPAVPTHGFYLRAGQVYSK